MLGKRNKSWKGWKDRKKVYIYVCIGTQKRGRTEGGDGLLLHIDRGKDQPVNSDSLFFFSRTFEEKDMSRHRIIEIQSAKWKHESEDNCIWEALLSITKGPSLTFFSSLLNHHHSTFLFHGRGVSDWEGKREMKERIKERKIWWWRMEKEMDLMRRSDDVIHRTCYMLYIIFMIRKCVDIYEMVTSWNYYSLMALSHFDSMKAEEVLRGFNKWRKGKKEADRSDGWEIP